MLVSAIFAVGVGITLFWDTARFAAVGEYFTAQPLRFLWLGLFIAAAAVFVFLPERLKDRR